MSSRLTPLEEALKFEEEGKSFFTEAAERSGDPLTKEIYSYLAYMETKHIEDILRISEELKKSDKFPTRVTLSAKTERSAIFKEELDKIVGEKMITQDEVTALRKALALEVRGRDMYLEFMKGASDDNEKSFYGLLAEEEQKHFDIIYEFLDYFESKGLKMQE